MKVKQIVLILVGALVIAGGVYCYLRAKPDQSEGDSDVLTYKARSKAIATNAAHHVRHSKVKGAKINEGADTDVLPAGTDVSRGDSPSAVAKAIRLLNDYLVSDEFKALSKDRQDAVRMRLALDGGDRHLAMRYARNLMDSDDVGVRRAVLDAFGWIGKDALPEITQMLADEDRGIAETALEKWTDSFREIPEEVDRAQIIVDVLPTLRTQVEADAILMELTKMQLKTAVDTIVKVVSSGESLGAECARDMYEHLTGGEVYESREQADMIVDRIMRLRNGENYDTVMKETGGADLILPKKEPPPEDGGLLPEGGNAK